MLAIRLPESIEKRLTGLQSAPDEPKRSTPARPSWRISKTSRICTRPSAVLIAFAQARTALSRWTKWWRVMAWSIMVWKVEFSPAADRELSKLDPQHAQRIGLDPGPPDWSPARSLPMRPRLR